MAWFKVDDGFWSHPKTATLSDAAVTLWVRAGSYSCQHLTDGVIQAPVLRLLGDQEAAQELVSAGLWISAYDGWRFHDWDEYQETSEAVKQRRADARERQRRARESAALKRRESRGASRVTDGVTDSVSNGVSSLYPTRPDPTRPSSTSNEVEHMSSLSFDSVWETWPKKTEKDRAEKEYAKHSKSVPDLAEKIADFGRAYAATTEKKYIPSLAAWLHRKRWTDELPEPAGERDAWMNRSTSRADEAQDFIQRLEAIDATRGSGEAVGDHPQLR